MAHGDSLPQITESQILTSYLLPPSALPTIIPYSSFLALAPAIYRNNPDFAPALKQLYRDLQFQRSITIDQVRENIESECGAKAASLKARLAQRIALEEGEVKAEDEDEIEGSAGRRRKRRKIASERAGKDRDADASAMEIKDEDESIYSSDNEFTDPLHLVAHQTMYDHPSSLHPAAHVLKLPDNLQLEQLRSTPGSEFHTKASLLDTMENASRSLEKEIEDLEAECARMKESIGETVGSLSDLRYGKRHSEGVGDDGEYADVLEALQHFQNVMRAKTHPQDRDFGIGVS